MNTIGEDRVRTSFNPSNDSRVDQVKQKSAELINFVNDHKLSQEQEQELLNTGRYGEYNRLKDKAMEKYEEAAMWAVKLETFK